MGSSGDRWTPDGRAAWPRPLDPHELLWTARRLVRANLGPIAAVMAVFVFPVYLAWAFVAPSDMNWTSPFMPALPLATLSWFGALPSPLARALAMLLGFTGVSVAVATITRLTARSYLTRDLAGPERPGPVARRLPGVVTAFAAVHALEAGGLLLAVAVILVLGWSGAGTWTAVAVGLPALLAVPVVALLAMTLSFVTMPALIVEGRTVLGALRRSVALIRWRFWTSLAVVTSGGVLAMVLLVGLHTPFALVYGLSGEDGPVRAAWPIQSLGGMVASLATIPFFVTLATVVYFDLRARFEGQAPA